MAEAMRSEERTSVGGFGEAVWCNLIYLLKRSLWLHLENGQWGERAGNQRVYFVLDKARYEECESHRVNNMEGGTVYRRLPYALSLG